MANRLREHVATGNRRAVIVGATGSTGKHVLSQLLASDKWTKVTSVTRRKIDIENPKLTQIVSDFDKLSETAEKWKDHDVLFNCIGTTRSQAGGAEQFKKIEVGYTEIVASIARAAGISHVSVISAQSANHNQAAVDWIHPLLYARSMGQKEQAIITKGFPRVSVFRPGMLHRDNTDRKLEKLISNIIPGLPTESLARAMIHDAESTPITSGTPEQPLIYGNSEIYALAARATAGNQQ
eukprot:c18141_g1_i1.p1 GENE.c18141_g1_i1~~c18141_g1_i1.p1  ORF type:complete len:272 (-),score=52.55 c18141_g1_i1:100-813(-)